MVKIIEVDGIPCIILPIGIIRFKEEARDSIKIRDFSEMQSIKEGENMRDILKELMETVSNKGRSTWTVLSENIMIFREAQFKDFFGNVLKEMKKRFAEQ